MSTNEEIIDKAIERLREREIGFSYELSPNPFEYFIDRLETIQANMQVKAKNKDHSIIIDVFELDEVINELKTEIWNRGKV